MLTMHKKTIQREFFVTGLTSALIIAFVFILLGSIRVYTLNIENAREKLKSVNQHLTTYTEGVLESLVISTKMNAAYPEVRQYKAGDKQVQATILKLFAATTQSNPNIKFSYAGYEDGTLLINNYLPPHGYDPRVRPWYTSALASFPSLSVGLPYQEAVTNEWLVSISLALKDDSGKTIGVVAVDCTLQYVKDLMAEISYYKSQSNYVIDSNNKMFVHQNQSYLNRNLDSIIPDLSHTFSDELGYIHYILDGKTRMAYYQKMKIADWIIVTSIDENEIMQPLITNLSLFVVGLIVIAVLLGMGQVLLYKNSFVKPITSLRDRVHEITSGAKVTHRSYQYSNVELAGIANQIEDMAETSLRKKNEELKLILDSTSDAILVLDLVGKTVHANGKFHALWDTLLSEHISEGQHQNDLDNPEETLKTLKLENGMVLEQYACPVVDQGVVQGRLWRYRDITNQVKAEENLIKLATTDSLTELWNRRYFLEQGEWEVTLTKRTNLPTSLLFIDIDYFKHVNDTYGHSVGDEALKAMAATLKKHVRSTDLVARLGGEEFCILAPNTNLEDAFIIAEKLRSYFETYTFMVNNHTLQYTLSIGVASVGSNTSGIDDLLAKADEACYIAKGKGRNCVVASENVLSAPESTL